MRRTDVESVDDSSSEGWKSLKSFAMNIVAMGFYVKIKKWHDFQDCGKEKKGAELPPNSGLVVGEIWQNK